MKVLFLDIDGVLTQVGDAYNKVMIAEGISVPYLWNEECCAAVMQIVRATGCEIVLSSDWRKHYTLPAMRQIFNYNKIVGDFLIGFTQKRKEYMYGGNMGYGRSLEITDWLNLHGVKDWCAVDDLALIALEKDRFVRTVDAGKAIMMEGAVDRIIDILNGKQ